MLFKLSTPEYTKIKDIGLYLDDISPDRMAFWESLPFGFSGIPSFEFETPVSDARKWDVLPNSADIPLVSAKVRSLMEGLCPADVEFVPARIFAKDGEIRDYFLVNVLAKVTCVDLSRSTWNEIGLTKSIRSFTSVTLYDEACMGSHMIAREASYFPWIMGSQNLRDIFEQERIKGLAFSDPKTCV